jgi:hypothetical protein
MSPEGVTRKCYPELLHSPLRRRYSIQDRHRSHPVGRLTQHAECASLGAEGGRAPGRQPRAIDRPRPLRLPGLAGLGGGGGGGSTPEPGPPQTSRLPTPHPVPPPPGDASVIGGQKGPAHPRRLTSEAPTCSIHTLRPRRPGKFAGGRHRVRHASTVVSTVASIAQQPVGHATAHHG